MEHGLVVCFFASSASSCYIFGEGPDLRPAEISAKSPIVVWIGHKMKSSTLTQGLMSNTCPSDFHVCKENMHSGPMCPSDQVFISHPISHARKRL